MEISIVIAFYIVILLYSIILHEIAHGVAALRLGDYTAKNEGRLTLNPLPHIDPIGSILLPLAMLYMANFAFGWARPVPYNPYVLKYLRWGPVLVAIAGPATNFVLAIIAAAVGAALPIAAATKTDVINTVLSRDWNGIANLVSGDLGVIFFFLMVVVIFWNVLLGLFNLLPLPPLDGSKILFTLVAVPENIKMFLEQWGFVILIGLLLMTPLGLTFSMILQSVLDVFLSMAV